LELDFNNGISLNRLVQHFSFDEKGFLKKVVVESTISIGGSCVNMKNDEKCWLDDDDEDDSVTQQAYYESQHHPEEGVATSYSLVTADNKHVFDVEFCECMAGDDSFATDSLYPVFVADDDNVCRDPNNADSILELRGNPTGHICIIDFILLKDINRILEIVTPMKPKVVVVKRKLETIASVPLFVVSVETLSNMKNLCNDDCSVSIRNSCTVQQFVSGEDSAGTTSRCEMTHGCAPDDDDNRLKLSSDQAENHIAVLDVATTHPLDDRPESILVCLTVHQMFMTCINSNLLKMY
jgi:hypothetical protein